MKILCRSKPLLAVCILTTLTVLSLTLGVLGFMQSTKDYKAVFAEKKEYSVANTPDTPGSASESAPVSVAVYQKYETAEDRNLLTGSKNAAQYNNINILFLGTDRTEERDKTLGIYRTDTIALAKINLDTKKVDVINIPRDTYAYIPIIGKKDKINHAYAFGSLKGDGVKSSIEAINNFIKYSNVDYYFTLDMEPIAQIVDELNGVELEVECDIKTHGVNLTKGFQLLDGKKAYGYIHWRYSAGGDIDRIKRQQKFFKAMYTKLKEKDQLLKAAKMAITYEQYIKTNMKPKQLVSLAMLAKDIPAGNTTFYTIPGEGKYINGISYWLPNEQQTDSLLKQILYSN